MAGMIFRIDTFFKGSDNFDQLIRILKVLGEDDLNAYVKKYDLTIPKECVKLMKGQNFPKRPWESFINESNKHLVDKDGLDLLSKMLVYDKNLRITPKDAMAHRYFDPIREFAKLQEERGED
jgi:casein kinase II subunit alpha